ncbi:hypothetical protein RISK_006442 [Rhodopirellula islandica]|uniref:Uncharacterized protein n=1 Tax=Rhodopirellula islandica TaxID=595434 RepID=A0A0J1B467_RHOIS|nr:hypothetical protein RISK_006442 [Rhodopirellula islandica]
MHGLNYASEKIGVGQRYGGMVDTLVEAGDHCIVVITRLFYPQ